MPQPIGLLLTTDLICSSKVTGTAALLGGEMRVARDLDAAIAICREKRPACVLIDLAAVEDVAAAIGPLADAAACPMVAFGAHVDRQRLDAARQSGCEAVPRSRFTRELPGILRRYLSDDSQ